MSGHTYTHTHTHTHTHTYIHTHTTTTITLAAHAHRGLTIHKFEAYYFSLCRTVIYRDKMKLLLLLVHNKYS